MQAHTRASSNCECTHVHSECGSIYVFRSPCETRKHLPTRQPNHCGEKPAALATRETEPNAGFYFASPSSSLASDLLLEVSVRVYLCLCVCVRGLARNGTSTSREHTHLKIVAATASAAVATAALAVAAALLLLLLLRLLRRLLPLLLLVFHAAMIHEISGHDFLV